MFALCWVLCLCICFVFLAWILVSKFCSISPVFVRCCVWPRESFFTLTAAFVVFPGYIDNAASLGECLLCFVWTFFVFFVFFLVVDFVWAFLLICCCVACAARLGAFFVVLLFLSVSQLGLGVPVSLCGVLCARVCALRRFTCTCHVQIFWLLLLLLHIQKHVLLANSGIFFPCFCFDTCLCIHPHPSEPICTHLHPFVSLFIDPPKTWCPGKFPRPYAPKFWPARP